MRAERRNAIYAEEQAGPIERIEFMTTRRCNERERWVVPSSLPEGPQRVNYREFPVLGAALTRYTR